MDKGREYENSLDKDFRKQEGIFYSPNYITNYIVNQAVSNFLEEQTDKFLALQNIKIIDLACGAGAFLLESFDFLLQIYRNDFVDFTNCVGVENIKRHIIANNLFGVDVDLEAVALTQQQLFLQSGFMCHNIKTGNSLIADKTVTEKAFVWETQFAEIMANGGFDVVVGNPPYVVIKGGRFLEGYQYPEEAIKYIRKHYQTAEQQVNTYILFVEKAINLINKNALISFIIPNTFLSNEYSKKFRAYILEKTQVVAIYNVGLVFDTATVETLILTLRNSKTKKINKTRLKIADQVILIDLLDIAKLTTDQKFILHINDQNLPIILKINANPLLAAFAKVSMGISTGDNKKYLSLKATTEKHKKVVSGSEVNRYYLNKNIYFVYYEPELLDRAREESIFLNNEKLISKFVGTKLTFCYDNEQYYVLNTACSVVAKSDEMNIKYLLILLNSKVLDWYFHLMFSDYRETFPIMKSGNIESLPIPKISEAEQTVFIELADKMLVLHKKYHKIADNFIELSKSELKLKKISTKLTNWYNLTWEEFSDELKKVQTKLSLKQLSEWKQFYTEEQITIQTYLNQIKQTDKHIDNLVYKLYNLSAEEIEIIEKSFEK
jgi:hypothetical protein